MAHTQRLSLYCIVPGPVLLKGAAPIKRRLNVDASWVKNIPENLTHLGAKLEYVFYACVVSVVKVQHKVPYICDDCA